MKQFWMRFLVAMTLVVSAKTGVQTPVGSSGTSSIHVIPFYLTPDTVNVKTVLFKESDLEKTCWNAEDIVLLATRLEMQSLIPKKVPENLTALLEYYTQTLSLESMNLLQTDDGYQKKLLLSAYADAVGGYLNYAGIPAVNAAYYEGRIDYKVAKELHNLFDTVKNYLHTSGEDWREPSPITGEINAEPIDLNFTDGRNSCGEFYLTRTGTSGTGDLLPIPMPYLDDEKTPNSIALPFRFRSLFSLGNENSTNLLLRYYELGLSCLAASYTEEDVSSFNNKLRAWIFKSVLPHLQESKWYPGFWGVTKIIETMKRLDLTEHPVTPSSKSTTNEQFSSAVPTPSLTTQPTAFLWLLRESPYNDGSWHCLKNLPARTLLVAVLCFALVLVLPYLFYLVLCKRKRDLQQSLPNKNEMDLLNSLVKLYWEIRESNRRNYKKLNLEDGSDDELAVLNFQRFKNVHETERKNPARGKKNTGAEEIMHIDNPSLETFLLSCPESAE